jgi:DNA-binding MarR family transcriptional regulator
MLKKTQETKPIPENDLSNVFRSLIEIVWYFGPKSLDGTCCENLSMPEYIALDKISNTENCPVQEIGIKLGFTKSGATRIVNRLEMKGFVKKHKYPDDARICCITITSKGQQALDSAGGVCAAKLERLITKMPASSQIKIKESLTIMAKALSE